MRLGLLARRTPVVDPQTERYRAAAVARGVDVVVIDSAAFVSGGVDIHVGGALVVDGVDLATLTVLLTGPLPGPAALLAPASSTATAAQHQARARVQLGRAQLARAAVREAERRGVRVVSPTSSWVFDEKPEQLFAFARAGLPVPDTHLGDVGSGDGADWVVKPITAGEAVDHRSAEGAARRGVPRILQARVRGADVRAVVVGGRCVCVGRYDDEDDAVVDVRARAGFASGAVRWVRDDDARIAALAEAAAAVVGVDVAAVDLKRSADGTIALLELNRTPVVADLADDLGCDVEGAVVSWIQAGCST